MKKWWSRLICAAAAAVLAAAMATPAWAEGTASVSIPVTVALSGSIPEQKETYRVRLTAENGENPMPKGSRDGVYTMKVSGAGTRNLALGFDRVGVYRYTVTQAAGTNSKCVYDGSVYTLTVQVRNRAQGGLEATAVLHRGMEAEKAAYVRFENRYTEEGKNASAAPKTGDSATAWLDLLLLAGSAGTLGLLALTRKRRPR